MRQLAALAGVSRTTVSLALRNHPSISEATQSRILKLAKEQGYTPDPLVSSLMNQLRTSRKSRLVEKIAFITSWPTRDGWLDAEFNQCAYRGACARAAKQGYEIEVVWGKEPGLTSSRLTKILYTRAIRGIIIAPLLRSKGHLSLDWKYFAAVTISNTLVKPALYRASHSHYQGMSLGLRRLKQLGFKRVGFANLLDQDERVNHGWLAGYLVYQHGQSSRNRIPTFLTKKWVRSDFALWLKENRPDAIISNSEEALELIQEIGYRVPDDVAYASLDRWEGERTPAGIDQLPEMTGAAAVDLVISLLQNNEFGLPRSPKTVNLEGVWCDGWTVNNRIRSK
ncbi:MAG: LacI family DNA-binding transcriptional regulator [Chthoniobacteraceae bacterium]|nr:LacI family DNA-binding transcriptional regulator [Chthoniobacteraceae bacterium]